MQILQNVRIPAATLSWGLEIPRSDKVQRMVSEMAKQPIPMNEPTHFFGDKCYVRELTVSKGTVVAGARHKKRHVFAVIKGWMWVYDGEDKRRVEAGDVFEGRPGTQRIAWAPEVDCSCIAIHGTEETDLTALEAELVEMQGLTYQPMEMLE